MWGGGVRALQGSDGDGFLLLFCRPEGNWSDRLEEQKIGRKKNERGGGCHNEVSPRHNRRKQSVTTNNPVTHKCVNPTGHK